MKAFDLKETKAGMPVCTKSGNSVRILAFDFGGDYPILAAITIDGKEQTAFYLNDGTYKGPSSVSDDSMNLMMKTTPVEKFIFIFINSAGSPECSPPYPTNDAAKIDYDKNPKTISPIVDVHCEIYQ
jgi:hypothetical protein